MARLLDAESEDWTWAKISWVRNVVGTVASLQCIFWWSDGEDVRELWFENCELCSGEVGIEEHIEMFRPMTIHIPLECRRI
jgi:hypothetical protein